MMSFLFLLIIDREQANDRCRLLYVSIGRWNWATTNITSSLAADPPSATQGRYITFWPPWPVTKIGFDCIVTHAEPYFQSTLIAKMAKEIDVPLPLRHTSTHWVCVCGREYGATTSSQG